MRLEQYVGFLTSTTNDSMVSLYTNKLELIEILSTKSWGWVIYDCSHETEWGGTNFNVFPRFIMKLDKWQNPIFSATNSKQSN